MKINKFMKQQAYKLGNIPELKGKTPSEILMSVLFTDGHIHRVIPDSDSRVLLLRDLDERFSFVKKNNKARPLPDRPLSERKIIFKHSRGLGDGLMFTAGVRDFKLLFPDILINVDSNQTALWENSPYLDRSLKRTDKDVEYYEVGYPMIGNVNFSAMHFSTMFLFDMIAITDLHQSLGLSLGEFVAIFANGTVGDPPLGNLKKNSEAREPFISLRNKYVDMCKKFVRQRGDLHLTLEEKQTNIIRDIYGIEKYWVVAPGGKRDCTAKIWDWRRFQDVIDYFEGKIHFITIGKSDLLVEKLRGVTNLVDKFNKDIRGLMSLVYNAEGCVSGPSFLLHLAAAIPPRFENERKPCVEIFGGREPNSWSSYGGHQVLHTVGSFDCCKHGGCWKARVVPLQKDPKHNKNLCKKTIKLDGRTVQQCMYAITPQDVIRAIEKYYDGNMYHYMKPSKIKSKPVIEEISETPLIEYVSEGKEINLLGNLNTSGGGEQSLCMIAKMLTESGWKVKVFPWSSVEEKFRGKEFEYLDISKHSFKDGNMLINMNPGLPLLFYANDCVGDFVEEAESIVANSSSLITGINYVNGPIPKCKWLQESGKLKAVVFQNTEKKDEFVRDAFGFEDTNMIVLYGAIDLTKYLEVCPKQRAENDPLVILKHCKPDYRKYVTQESAKKGDKIHIWQKNIIKEEDVKFYGRLLKSTKNVRFEFMEAHGELIEEFKDNPHMVFHKWDSMDVGDFLARGHIYLYRTSNVWRDQYPRGIGEALAVGLPVLCEPRDGPLDRIQYGNTGFHCVDYDQYKENILKLQRKEGYRHKMGMYAKDWARDNLDPRKWVEIVEENAI